MLADIGHLDRRLRLLPTFTRWRVLTIRTIKADVFQVSGPNVLIRTRESAFHSWAFLDSEARHWQFTSPKCVTTVHGCSVDSLSGARVLSVADPSRTEFKFGHRL